MVYVFLGALLVGVTLGLMGSGGSILTVPVLVYVLGHEGKVAIAESLAIVGLIALFATVPYARTRMVDWRNVAFFGLPGMAGSYLGAWSAKYVPETAQLLLFAVIMLLAAGMMLRSRSGIAQEDASASIRVPKAHASWKIGVEGLVVGVITGLVGVGGGFLIVPALVVLGGLPMRLAVGTSLAIIAMKSLSGFYKYLDVLATLHVTVDWQTVAVFAAIGMVGSLAGRHLAVRVNQLALRRAFAGFLIIMGLFVIGKEGFTQTEKSHLDPSPSVNSEELPEA